MLTTAVEDYVKAIYAHTEWQPEAVTPSRLAQSLGLAASTVTEMVKKLVTAGLVDHRPYGAIELTEAGQQLALRQVRRHRLIETWLVEQHGYGWDEVHDEAEVLEHGMSDRLVESIADALGNPNRDPHGDPIPAVDGSVRRPRAVLLSELAPGDRGRVARISDADPGMLRFLAEQHIALDAEIEVLGKRPYTDTLSVRTSDGTAELGQSVAASVWVAPRS